MSRGNKAYRLTQQEAALVAALRAGKWVKLLPGETISKVGMGEDWLADNKGRRSILVMELGDGMEVEV